MPNNDILHVLVVHFPFYHFCIWIFTTGSPETEISFIIFNNIFVKLYTDSHSDFSIWIPTSRPINVNQNSIIRIQFFFYLWRSFSVLSDWSLMHRMNCIEMRISRVTLDFLRFIWVVNSHVSVGLRYFVKNTLEV